MLQEETERTIFSKLLVNFSSLQSLGFPKQRNDILPEKLKSKERVLRMMNFILNLIEALILKLKKLFFSKSHATYPIHFDCKGDEENLHECETKTARPCECDLLEHTTDVFIECEGQREKKFKYSSGKRAFPRQC